MSDPCIACRAASVLGADRRTRRMLLAQPGTLHDRAGARASSGASAQGDRAAADRSGAISGALADRPIVRELPAGCDVERLVGRAAGGDARPRAGRANCSQRLPQSVVFSESGAVSAQPDATIDGEYPAARRGRERATSCCRRRRASSSKARGNAGAAQISASPCHHRRRTCRARSRRSAPRWASLRTGSRQCGGRRSHRPMMRGVRGWHGHAAAAARMPRLRAVPDDPAAGRGMTADVRALFHHPASTNDATRSSHSIALTLAALVLLMVMCTTTLMSVQTAGIAHSAYLLSGPAELVRRGMAALAAVVVFVTVLAPFGKLIGTLYVLLRLARGRAAAASSPGVRPGRTAASLVDDRGVRIRRVRRLREARRPGAHHARRRRLRVAGTDRRHDLGRQRARSRGGLAAARPRRRSDDGRTAAGRRRIWPSGRLRGMRSGQHAQPDDHAHCPRCGTAALHTRKPDSVARTWALVIAAAVLYVPANYYPGADRDAARRRVRRARSSAASKS